MANNPLEEGSIVDRLLGLPPEPMLLRDQPVNISANQYEPRVVHDVPEPGMSQLSRMLGVLERGLPASSFHVLCEAWQLPRDRMAQAVSIAPRTLARRKVFKPDESDRIFRLGTIIQAAVNLFDGDEAAARAWLQRPQFGLGGAIPLELARTELGAQEVRNLISRLDEGIFA